MCDSTEPRERLESYYLMLRARSFMVAAPPSPEPPAWVRLQTILGADSKEWKWNLAYEAEELLIQFLDDAAVQTGFEALLVEAKDYLELDVINQRKTDFQNAPAGLPKKIVFKSLAEDLHEYWATKDERLEYFRRITKSTALFLEWFLVALVLSLIALGVRRHYSPQYALYPSLFNLPLLLIVLTSGLFGAGLSMLIGLAARLEAAKMPDLEKMSLSVNRWARSAVGAGAAFILFAMCLAGLLQGKAMPELQSGDPIKPMEVGTLAHLVVLCILAGFSEKFVPSKLSELEK